MSINQLEPYQFPSGPWRLPIGKKDYNLDLCVEI